MDDRMRTRVQEFAEQLLAEQKKEFRSAATLREIEELTGQIGDELTRQLANSDLSGRAEEIRRERSAFCPDCERECPLHEDPEAIILQGRRSELEYLEPRCYCPSCRRDFFPTRPSDSATGPGDGHAVDA